MEWFSFFALLWFVFFVYVPYFYIGLSWEFMTLFAFCYMVIKWKRWDGARSWRFWRWLREDMLRMEFRHNVKLLNDKKHAYLFTFYPHGAHCISATLMSTMMELTHIRVACTSVLFWTPIINAFVGWGNAVPATKYVMQQELQKGTSLIVYPGGFNEIPGAHFLRQDEHSLEENEDERYYTYNRRSGFVELAKQQSIRLVPVWVEGEYDTFRVRWIMPWLSRITYRWTGLPWPMWTSGWYGTFLPKRGHMKIYIGQPQETLPEMSTEKIKQAHLEQLESLKQHAREDTNREKSDRSLDDVTVWQRIFAPFQIGRALEEED